MHRCLGWLLLGWLACMPAPRAAAIDNGAGATLREGVAEIAGPGSPGAVSVFGPNASAVVMGPAGAGQAAVVAAGEAEGGGRVVAFGHNGYFGGKALDDGDTLRLVVNAVRWAGRGDAPKVGIGGLPELAQRLRGRGLVVIDLDRKWRSRLGGLDVVILHPRFYRSDADAQALRGYLTQVGGGLVMAQTGWGWRQLNPGKSLGDDMAANRIIRPAGLAWSGAMVKKNPRGGINVGDVPAWIHAGVAVDRLVAQSAGEVKLKPDESQGAAAVIVDALSATPHDPGVNPLRRRLDDLREQHAAGIVPTPKTPIKPGDGLARVLLTLEMLDLEALPVEADSPIPAHPSATHFPGAVPPDAERVTKRVTIDLGAPGWHSTGLYAPPGEVIRVSGGGVQAGRPLHVRIGCHKDNIARRPKWPRVPRITRRFVLTPETLAANPFGGLVYIEAPKGLDGGVVEVEIAGAVRAPLYVHGRTDLDDWRKTLRHHPAPWAELASDKVVVTVPAEHVRDLDDPAEVMAVWDRVLDACADLRARPRDRERPERIVADVEISAGYMHAGYPIMTHLDAAATMVSARKLRGGAWGLYHELGHNHQDKSWTFGGTGEVTCNLFTLYVYETVCGIGVDDARKNLSPEKRRERIRKHLVAGAPFDQWQRDPFLALMMYVQLREAFGWQPFIDVFAEYDRMPAGRRPKTDAQKRDQWMIRVSRRVGRDLGPFFEAWGVPVSDAARAEVAGLPGWMPDDWPG